MMKAVDKKDYPKTRAKWRRWMKKINKIATDVVIDNYIFRRSMEIINTSKKYESNPIVVNWVKRSYATHVAMGVRRLIDKDGRTYSLFCLIQSISENPQIVTRKSYVTRYPKHIKRFGQEDFNQFVGAGNDTLTKEIVIADLNKLEKMIKHIGSTISKIFAHSQRKSNGKKKIKWFEIHRSIAELDKLCIRYSSILNQDANFSSLLPENVSDYDKDIRSIFGEKREKGDKGGHYALSRV